METGRRKDWREEESIEDAVRRLIGVMDERKKRRASGAQSPEQIAYPDVSPSGKGGDQKASTNNGSAVLKPSGHQITPPRGGNGSGHTAKDPRKDSSGLDGWRGSGPVETRKGDVAMRPPAQPSAGSYSNGFTIEAGARNVRSGKSD